MSRSATSPSWRKRTGSTVVVLAASVGALPGAHDYLSLFDTNIAALLAAAATR